MEFNNVISKRQSVRQFLKEKVDENDVKIILDAACKAPVARGLYDDYLLIVLEGDKLKKIQDVMAKTSPRGDCTYGAPLVLVVAYKGQENEPMEQSIGCIIENMQLAATNLNLGSVIIYSIKPNYLNDPELKKAWDLKEFVPECCLAVGMNNTYKYIDKKHVIKIQ